MILVFKTNKDGTKVPNHTTSHPNSTVKFVINLNIFFTVQIRIDCDIKKCDIQMLVFDWNWQQHSKDVTNIEIRQHPPTSTKTSTTHKNDVINIIVTQKFE